MLILGMNTQVAQAGPRMALVCDGVLATKDASGELAGTVAGLEVIPTGESTEIVQISAGAGVSSTGQVVSLERGKMKFQSSDKLMKGTMIALQANAQEQLIVVDVQLKQPGSKIRQLTGSMICQAALPAESQ